MFLKSKKEKLENLLHLVEEANNELSLAQEEIDSIPLPEGAQPKARIQKRDQLLLRSGQLEASLAAQKTATKSASDQFSLAERSLFEADREINRYAETLEDTLQSYSLMKQLDKQKAERIAKMESKRLARIQKIENTILEAKESQIKELNDIKERQAEVAKTLNKEARNRVAVTSNKTRMLTEKIKEKNEAEINNRTEAILELKTNLDASRAIVASLAEKHVNKIADAEKRLENEKRELSTKGLNPYVEFRKKELATEYTLKEEKIINKIEKNKLELTNRIEKEEKFIKKKENTILQSKETEKKHRENQGRHVTEEKNRNYIIEKTSKNVELLDPTGKLDRVDPSQITDIPDYSFGLGKSSRIPAESMRRITENIRKKFKRRKR